MVYDDFRLFILFDTIPRRRIAQAQLVAQGGKKNKQLCFNGRYLAGSCSSTQRITVIKPLRQGAMKCKALEHFPSRLNDVGRLIPAYFSFKGASHRQNCRLDSVMSK